MTKKDFTLIARTLYMLAADETIINGLAEAFANDNPRFDHERFRKAALRVYPKPKYSLDGDDA